MIIGMIVPILLVMSLESILSDESKVLKKLHSKEIKVHAILGTCMDKTLKRTE